MSVSIGILVSPKATPFDPAGLISLTDLCAFELRIEVYVVNLQCPILCFSTFCGFNELVHTRGETIICYYSTSEGDGFSMSIIFLAVG